MIPTFAHHLSLPKGRCLEVVFVPKGDGSVERHYAALVVRDVIGHSDFKSILTVVVVVDWQ